MLKKRLTSASLVAVIALALVLADGGGTAAADEHDPDFVAGGEASEFVADQLIISFVPGTTIAQITGFYKEHGLEQKDDLDFDKDDDDPEIKVVGVQLPREPGEIRGLIDLLQEDSRVEYVHLDYIITIDFLPDDQFFPLQWGLHNTGQSGGHPMPISTLRKPGISPPARPMWWSPSSTPASITPTLTWRLTSGPILERCPATV